MQSRVARQIASAVFGLNRDSRSTPSKISSPMVSFVALRHLEFVHLSPTMRARPWCYLPPTVTYVASVSRLAVALDRSDLSDLSNL